MRSRSFFQTLICLLFPLLVFSQVDLNNGLVAYYPFNGNANDVSGNGNNPIFNNATLVSDYYGNPNGAYHFNGINNYMEIANSASLKPGNAISICAWIKPTGFYYGNCHGNSVLIKGDNDFQEGNYMLRFDDAFYTGTNCNGGKPDTVHETYYGIGTGLTPVQDTPYAQKNFWRSLVYTYDGSHARLYIDCNLILDTETPGLNFSNNDNLFFGKLNSNQFPYWLNADLDEIRIYNRPLSLDEVKAYSFTCADIEPCNNWAKITSSKSGIQIGDLDIIGDKVTVEATFNRTSPYSGSQLYAGDLVSKHEGPSTVNYLLRPNSAEITTTKGYFKTPDICDIQLNKTYHVAMVYDGKELKFYRNGFLMSKIACSGNLYQNNYLTAIGTFAFNPNVTNENLVGYINEVRIWDVVRTQDDIKKYMNQPLPNPASQTGLLAYYTFDDLKNKQGNSQWDGSILGNANINQTNPNCEFIADSCNVICNLKTSFSYEQNTCNPNTVQFQNKTLNADSIWWDFGDGKTAGNVQNPFHQYTGFGNYIVQLYSKTNAGCLDTATDTILVAIQKDSAIITNDTSICAGSSIQLNAINGLNYCWSPAGSLSDSSIQNPLASPAITTTYYLNILIANNEPVIRDSVTVTIIQPPVVNAGKDTSVCKGSAIQLNASGANTYNWNASTFLSDTTISNPLAAPINTTNFIVRGFNPQGCFDTDTIKVSVLQLPIFSLTNDTAICKTGSIMLQAKATGNNSFKWSPSAGLSDPNIFNPVASPADSTKYFVSVTDSDNCIAVDSVIVDVLNIPIVSAMNDTSICEGSGVTLQTNTSYASVFKWTPKIGLNNSNIKNPDASPLTSTLYTVTAGNGICSAKDSVLISILSLPVVDANNDTTVCGNSSAQLYAAGAVSYSWNPVKGLSDPKIYDPAATPGSTTKYYVTGTGSNSCTNIDSVTVTVDPAPAFSISPKNIALCKGDSVKLAASGGDTYLWLPSETVTDSLTPVTKVFPSVSTTYRVIITNTACKFTDSLKSNVTVKDVPAVTITKSNDIDCLNFEAQLIASGGMSYQWYPSTYISNTHIPNPVVYPPVDTKYIVVAKNEFSCKTRDSILVQSNTLNADAAKFEIANAFTPNHDGLNDCFSVKYWGPANFFDISIYDRWGYLVYHSNNINNCWDGTIRGAPQASGTYVYKISVSSKCSNGLLYKKGTVVLMR